MAWSNDVLTRFLTGSFQSPSGAPAQGKISFKPTTKIYDPDDAIIVNDSSLTATLDINGSFIIELPTTDNQLLRPKTWLYEVNERIYGAKPEKYYIYFPYDDGLNIDISNVTITGSLPASSGTSVAGVVQGPIGPVGATGATGSSVLTGAGAPGNGLGNNGDTYINLTTSGFYSAKTNGAWPATPSFYLGGSTLRYVHTQSQPSSTWVITHNLNTKPNVVVVDSTSTQYFGDVVYTTDNTTTLSFSVAFSGVAYLS